MHPHLLVRILLPAFLLFSLSRLPAEVVLHGTVTDRTTGEVLVGANLYDTLTLKGTVTNSYGFYSLQLPASRGRIRVSYVGYNPLVVSLEGRCDMTLYLSLEPAATLEAVSVHARQEEEMLLRTAMGSFDLDHLLEGRMPSLMGETDLIKSVQLLPGVGSGMEGTSGLYVRGGGSDQNLVLLDGVPLYNVNHLFGFFSLFNGSAINKATLY